MNATAYYFKKDKPTKIKFLDISFFFDQASLIWFRFLIRLVSVFIFLRHTLTLKLQMKPNWERNWSWKKRIEQNELLKKGLSNGKKFISHNIRTLYVQK